MISTLISAIVILLLVALLFYVLQWVMAQIPIPQPVRTIIWILAIVIVIYAVAKHFGVLNF